MFLLTYLFKRTLITECTAANRYATYIFNLKRRAVCQRYHSVRHCNKAARKSSSSFSNRIINFSPLCDTQHCIVNWYSRHLNMYCHARSQTSTGRLSLSTLV